jgi:hypothetical protein
VTVDKNPYWSRRPDDRTLLRLHQIGELTKNDERTVRNITYKLYPDLHGKDLDRKYNTTIKDVVRGRILGMIPWENIRESRVGLVNGSGFEDVKNFMDFQTDPSNLIEWFSRDKTPSHKRYFECWFEKDTVSQEFSEVCEKYDVPYMAIRGQLTWTEKNNSARERLDDDSLILYFGDNDEKGREIIDVIKRDLVYRGCDCEIRWVAVTEEQEQRFDLPTNARIDGFELADLKELIEEVVLRYIDNDIYQKILTQEKKEMDRLAKVRINIQWEESTSTKAE